jgi:drug/metabolite transporter (DMT)-like permease
MFPKLKYQVLLHAIIIMWGFTGILGKLIHLDAIVIVWHRIIIAIIALFIAMVILKKGFKIPNKKRFTQILIIGVFVGLHWITFYQSIQLSTASLGILCLSTTTLHVAWIEPLITKRPFSFLELILGAVVIIGIYFVASDFGGDELKAVGFGLLSALFAAIFSVYNGVFTKDTKPSIISFYELISAATAITLILLFQGRFDASLFIMTASDFWWLLFLGVLCTSFAFLATIEVIKVLGAFSVSLSINLEPIYTIILAVFILNEDELLNNNFYLGASIIIVVVLLNALIKSSFFKKLFLSKK